MQKVGRISYRENPFVILFVINFLGFLSLSFLGDESKAGRVCCTILIFLYVLFKKTGLKKCLFSDSLVITCFLFALSCIPSILFSSSPIVCIYKIAELLLIPLFIVIGVSNFRVNNINIFKFLLFYFIFQTLVSFVGYFLDPSSMNIEENVLSGRNFVPMLRCNYPPFSSNGLGGIASVSFLTCVGYYFSSLTKRKKYLIYILGIISLFVLYKSSSRTAMLSTAIAFLFMIRKFVSFKNLFIIFILICFVGFFYIDSLISFFSGIFMKSQTDISNSSGGIDFDVLLSGRLRIWEIALENKELVLFGLGYGTAIKDLGIPDGNAHNSIVEIVINGGIIALFFWLRIWILLIKRYLWLIKYKKLLPFQPHWYYFSLGLVFMAFVRSWGNLSFVYWQLDAFVIISVCILFIYSSNYLKSQIIKTPIKINS